jgi:membrane-bound lytic murein transglycosylase D
VRSAIAAIALLALAGCATQTIVAPPVSAPVATPAPVAPAPAKTIAPITDQLVSARLKHTIDFSPELQGAIDDWLTWKREDLIEALENFAHLKPRIAPIYAEAGLPEALLFGMAAKESLARAHSYSPAGAAGMLQFMPATALRYGLRMQDRLDLRIDPEAATRANAQYVLDQLDRLDGDLTLVLAAYNSGEGRLERLHRKHPHLSFADPEIRNQLPTETQDFVPMVLAAAWLYLNLDAFELPQFDSQMPAALTLERPSSLGELTICLGAVGDNPDGWFRTLRNLNPRLKPGNRLAAGAIVHVPPPLAAAYRARCIDTPLAQKAATLHAANYPPPPTTVSYVVQRGDTLKQIAARSGCSLAHVAELNQLKAPAFALKRGQTLKLPRCES